MSFSISSKSASIERFTSTLCGPKTLKEEEQIASIDCASVAITDANFTSSMRMATNGAIELFNCHLLTVSSSNFANNCGPGILTIANVSDASIEYCNFVGNKGENAPILEFDHSVGKVVQCVFSLNEVCSISSSLEGSDFSFERCVFDSKKAEVITKDGLSFCSKCKYNQKVMSPNQVSAALMYEAFDLIMTKPFTPSSSFTPSLSFFVPDASPSPSKSATRSSTFSPSNVWLPDILWIQQYSMICFVFACGLAFLLFLIGKPEKQRKDPFKG